MKEPVEYDRAHPVRRALRSFAATRPGSWLFARLLDHLDRPVFRATRGRHTFASLVAGLPVVMLTTTGARTGRPRTVPLLALPTEHGMAVIASNFGQHSHPAWLHNLRANPHARLAVGPRTENVRAVEVTGERRDAIWQRALALYPGYGGYEKRAAHRTVHVFVLEPAGA